MFFITLPFITNLLLHFTWIRKTEGGLEQCRKKLFFGVGVGLDDECGRVGKRIKNPPTPPSYAKNRSIHLHCYTAKSHVWQARYLFIVF